MINLGLVVAAFNSAVTEQMHERAETRAADRDDITITTTVSVPGAYDTPLAADRLARTAAIDAVGVLGAIVTGDTDHDQVIAQATATKLTDVSLRRDTPVLLGVTGPGMSGAEARERTDIGARTVDDAVELVDALADLDAHESL